jgi:predicted nuclease of predicted toxin-antitoxin system
LKFLANENIPLASVTFLKSKGYDIKAIGLDNPSISDEEVMKIAIEEGRTVITYDSDYGELIFKQGFKPSGGVIFIRNQPKDPFETANLIERLLANSKLQINRTLTVVDNQSIRQKKY